MTPIPGETIVALARGWIGTPYRHQASVKGAGADCLGLVRGVWRDLIGPEPECTPRYSKDWNEPQSREVLWDMVKRHFVPISDHAASGHVLLFRMRSGAIAKHMGILVAVDGERRFIHAYSGHGVIESALTRPWERRIVACFAFPQTLDARQGATL